MASWRQGNPNRTRPRSAWLPLLVVAVVVAGVDAAAGAAAPHGKFSVSSTVDSAPLVKGLTLSGSVVWAAAPTGAQIKRVEFRIDGSVVRSEQSSPYRFNGASGELDTSTLSSGPHKLAVKAIASDGRTKSAEATVAVSAATSVSSSATSPSPIPADVPGYGVSLGGKSLFRSAADRAFELDQVQTAVNGHSAVVRIDSTPGNQSALDLWVTDATARNLEPLLILFGTAAPVSPDEAAGFAAAQGAKWRGRIRLYEFTNEPDLNGWTPEQYTAALKATYTALKAADPAAILIAGALWKWDSGRTAMPDGGAREWVRRMYADGAKGSFDALSLHFYDDPDDHGAWNLWDQAFTTGPSIRSIMDANGDQGIPIFSTESGGPTNKYGEAGQATIIEHAFDHLRSGQIRMLLVYTMLDDDVPGFGLLRNDRTRRPAWFAFQHQAV